MGVVMFIAVYVAAEVALVPGSLLTMAAGFAFGPIYGLLIASPASVLAATTAFLLSRTALRGWIQRKIAGSDTTAATASQGSSKPSPPLDHERP